MNDKKNPMILAPRICKECHKPYGESNLECLGIPIWVACDCMPKDKVYLINLDRLINREAEQNE